MIFHMSAGLVLRRLVVATNFATYLFIHCNTFTDSKIFEEMLTSRNDFHFQICCLIFTCLRANLVYFTVHATIMKNPGNFSNLLLATEYWEFLFI